MLRARRAVDAALAEHHSPPISERRPDRASARRPHRKGEAVVNVSDPSSRLMPTRRGFLQGYNAQVAVTADQIIVAVQVRQSTNDQAAFVPMMRAAAQTAEQLHQRTGNPQHVIGTVLADAGYASDANLAAPGPDRLIGAEQARCQLLARDVTPLRLAQMPRREHAGVGSASLSRGLDQGAARGEFGPQGPPRSLTAGMAFANRRWAVAAIIVDGPDDHLAQPVGAENSVTCADLPRPSVTAGRRGGGGIVSGVGSAVSVPRRRSLRACLRRSTDCGECAPLLSGGRAAAGDAAGDGVDRCPADHGIGHGRVAFVVAGQAAVCGQPGEGPFDPRVSQFLWIMCRRRPRLRGRPGFLAGWPAQGMGCEISRR